ncbi:MAG: 4-hydroxy-tetrahydrodipicolinate reductase, partial [Opitutales bacterium]|nr:4-hydroxy-tetrahydrodipicolinate reductase [Opitutales bacterium]
MNVKILLNGCKGRMGRAIIEAASATPGCEIFAACDMGDDASKFINGCDVVIDFSFRDATAALANLCAENKKPLVIGTTGHSAEQRAEILKATSEIPVVWAGNYSVGVNLLNYLTRIAAQILPVESDVEIVEMHHHFKNDAPSGTADKLLNVVKEVRKTPD